jgi:hypothetical protein
VTITVPTATDGRMIIIKDESGNCSNNPILALGTIDNEVDNYCTSWSIQDEYYITPIKDEKYNWALFRLSWDDNWGTWNWRFDARINFKGSYSNEVGKHILLKLWYKWDLDLNDTDNEPYVCLLNNL